MKKKITALLLCMAMFVTLLPMMAFAQDPVYYSEITGSWSKTPEMNEQLMNFYVNISTSGIHKGERRWLIKDEHAPGGWGNYGESHFHQGTYVYEVQLSCRADSPDDYKFLSKDVTLTVDGVEWTRLADTANDYSCWFRSPEYTVKEAEPEVKVISQVDLKWTNFPETGKTAKNSQFIVATTGIEDVGTFSWKDLDADAVFEKGTYRTDDLRIFAEEGYELADDLKINVEGSDELSGNVVKFGPPSYVFSSSLHWIAVEITLGDEEPETKEYTVTLNPNGGKGEAETLQTEGGKFTVPGCPFEAQEGYEFVRWEHSGAEVKIGDIITLSDDFELDAVWQPSTPPTPPTPPTEPEKGSITLTKIFSGIDTVPSDITFTVESKDGKYKEEFNIGTGFPPVRGSDKPTYKKELEDLDPGVYTITETNYKISGYKEKVMIKIGSGEPKVCDSTEVTIGEDEAISIAITDEYVEIKHNVTFEMNGHGTAPAAQSVKDGECAVKPEDPKADGYTFGGWYKDQGCTEKFEFTTKIKEDTVVYAKWTKDETKKDDSDKDNDGKDDKNNKGDKNKTGNKKNGSNIPTGDSTQEMPYIVILIAGLFCFAAAAAKKLRRY